MSPLLAALAGAQGGVFTRKQATRFHTRQQVDDLLRTGAWSTVLHGVYASAELIAAADDVRGHLLECSARLLMTPGDAVVSHESAAAAFRIRLLRRPVCPSLTIATPGPATRGALPGRYLANLPAPHRTTFLGVPMTSPARTVADLCRTKDTRSAVVVADGALALGLRREDVLAVLAECRRWPYVVAAREVLALASRWSESALESLSLHWCRVQGLPIPEQQLTIRQGNGRFVARVDLLWREHGTVGELDGRKKYVPTAEQLTRPALQPAPSALWQEKRREDAIRDTGLQVVRGYWSDDEDHGAAWADRVRRAFARSAAYTGAVTYRICDERNHAWRGPLSGGESTYRTEYAARPLR